MLKRLKDNFDSGVEKIKWFSSLLSDRLKIEISVMKLLHHLEQMEKKRDDLMKTIGRRVYELKEYPDRNMLKDTVVTDALNEIEVINAEIEALKSKASEISKIEG
jgi:seryl-tRNA synthetase